MLIAVRALPYQKEEWLSRITSPAVEVTWAENDIPAADACFDLTFEDHGPAFAPISGKPVFVSSVIKTLEELPANVSRINAWGGFLQKDIVEVVLRDDAKAILNSLGWKFREVPDIPGMISPRTVSMIINEAYFALGDKVSTEEDIDIAMKLGTNYPYGPFEWARKIGLHHVYRLLKHLSLTDPRYQPAAALEQELKAIA